MKKLNLLFVVLLASLFIGCSEPCEGSDFTTKQGICVFTNDFDVVKEEVEYVIYTLEEETLNRYPEYSTDDIRDNYTDTSVSFIEENVPIILPGGEEVEASGLVDAHAGPFIDDHFEIKVVFRECLTYSSLYHEILHVINITVDGMPEEYFGSTDAHPKGWFEHREYTLEENINSVEYLTNTRLWYELCPKGESLWYEAIITDVE